MSFGAFSIHDRPQGRPVFCVLIRCKMLDWCETNWIHQDTGLFCVNNQPRRLFDIEIWGRSATPFQVPYLQNGCSLSVCLSALTQLTHHDYDISK